ncbi:MAG TPA: polysaccharide lyase family 8 super-sandwich domain-containing protein, partial [bacterium]|nr:polysaccharide lyase family 8 super-sandwich domain-containing protein [bacterium]
SDPLYGTFGDVTDERSHMLTHSGLWARSVRTLALAYSTPASRYHHSDEILQSIAFALKGYGRWVYPGCPKPANWWAWDIGMPMNLVDAYILLQDSLPVTQADFLRDTLKHLVRTGVQKGLGANAIWVAWIQFRFGMSVDNLDYVQWGYETLNRQSQISAQSGDGIKPDYSYHFHAPGMNMGYGVSHYADISRYLFLTQGTPYAMQEPSVHVRWYLEYIRWLVFRDADDLYAYGRAGTRTDGKERAAIILESTLPFVALDSPDHDEIVADCKRLLADVPEFFSLLHASEQLTVEKSRVAPAVLEGFRYYPYSSCGIWRGRDFMGTVRLDSPRNKKWFSIHNENLLGHRIADGHLPLWVDGFETAGGVLPCQDWERLSGITGAAGFVLPRESLGQSTLSGGVSLENKYGLAAMELIVKPAQDGATLSARKSYLFLPDAAICLVSDACVSPSTAAAVPYTVLAQIPWNLPDKRPGLTLDGKELPLIEDKEWTQAFQWLHFRERGLVNLMPRDIHLTWQTTTSPWSRINQIMAPDREMDRLYTCSFLVAEHVHSCTDALAY